MLQAKSTQGRALGLRGTEALCFRAYVLPLGGSSVIFGKTSSARWVWRDISRLAMTAAGEPSWCREMPRPTSCARQRRCSPQLRWLVSQIELFLQTLQTGEPPRVISLVPYLPRRHAES